MNCQDARAAMLDEARGRLPSEKREDLAAHVAGCEGCAHEARAERLLGDLLQDRLPRYEAPASLRARLASLVEGGGTEGVASAAPATAPSAARSARRSRWIPAAAAAIAMSIAAFGIGRVFRSPAGEELMVREAVNDHLRITFSEHPVEIASGGIHQVKPWFAGKVDFAPAVSFSGDDDFPLVGGSVAYFVDRKAAAFVFKRRLHTISLLVFPADGFGWSPLGALGAKDIGGGLRATADSMHGFHVLLWQNQGLGYALVSDVDPAELEALARRVASVRTD
jgi:anti-sigma factor RsiW